MCPSPRASSYSLPAKYGGDVTTSATEASSTSSMWRASPVTILSLIGDRATSSSALSTGAVKRS